MSVFKHFKNKLIQPFLTVLNTSIFCYSIVCPLGESGIVDTINCKLKMAFLKSKKQPYDQNIHCNF